MSACDSGVPWDQKAGVNGECDTRHLTTPADTEGGGTGATDIAATDAIRYRSKRFTSRRYRSKRYWSPYRSKRY